MILLHDLKGVMRLDCSKDTCAHIWSCVEVVALIRRVYFYVWSRKWMIRF